MEEERGDVAPPVCPFCGYREDYPVLPAFYDGDGCLWSELLICLRCGGRYRENIRKGGRRGGQVRVGVSNLP